MLEQSLREPVRWGIGVERASALLVIMVGVIVVGAGDVGEVVNGGRCGGVWC